MSAANSSLESSSYRVGFEIGDPRTLTAGRSPAKIALEPGNVERGLLKLVLSLVELIRQLMEKQAVRRMDAGSLTSEETNRLGEGLSELEQKIRDLQQQFGIPDLNIDLGPIGKLLD
jgi:hypothetical protein